MLHGAISGSAVISIDTEMGACMHQRDRDLEGPLPAEVHRTLKLLATGLTSREVAARIGCPIEVVHERMRHGEAACAPMSVDGAGVAR